MADKKEYYFWLVVMILSYVFGAYMIYALITEGPSMWKIAGLLGSIFWCHFTTTSFSIVRKYYW